jgi:hypothetical protein
MAMTLSEISQALGAIGVIASIIYAAIQIRENSRTVRASAYQHFVSSFTSHWDELARNPELCSLMLRFTDDFESLDRIGKARVSFALTSLMRRYENAWIYLKNGTLKDSDVLSFHFQESMCSVPGFWATWDLIKNQSGDDFRAYIDSVIVRHKAAVAAKPPIPPVSPTRVGIKKLRRNDEKSRI